MNLQDFKDLISREAHGMTASEAQTLSVCIECRKTPTLESEAGRREYAISGLCESCFFEITQEEFLQESEDENEPNQ